MSIKLELKAGSFSGHVFPVDLDVAYDPDIADLQGIDADVYMFFDEGVVALVPKSISPAGTHMPGTGVIAWMGQTLDPNGAWKKCAAAFQWIDFRVGETAFNGAAVAGGLGTTSAQVLFVARPTTVVGLKRDKE